MKKSKLLSLVALASLGLSANAQVEPTDGGIYYLYNTESGQFLSRGNNWGTRGVTRPVGMPWTVAISNGAYTLRMYDIVTDNNQSGLGDNSFTDNGSPVSFTPSGDADGYNLAYGGGYLEAPATAGDINVKGSKSTWQFLTQAQYDAKLAAIASAQEAAVAQAAGITLSSGQTLADAIKDYAATATSLGTPTNSSWNVWAVPSRGGNQNQGGYGCEIYQGGGGYSQTVTGLKPGIYKVTVKGLKRVGANDNCYKMGKAGYSVSDAFMTVNDNVVPIASWFSACTSSSSPNSTDAAKAIWNNADNPGYKSSGFVYVGSEGTMDIKVTSEAYWGASWFLFGGVDYVYYSDAVSDEMVSALVATIPSEKVYNVYRQELDDAKAALEANPNLTNYNRLGQAIETAELNVIQYQNLANAIADFNAYVAVTEDAKTNLSAAIKAAQEVYDNASVENTSETIATLEKAGGKANVTDFNYVMATYTDAVALGSWTQTGFGTTSGQGYKDNSQQYYDKWNGAALDLSLSQDVQLPAGEYVLYGIGRGQANMSNVELFVSDGQTENVAPFRMKGDVGLGVDVDGVANFSSEATYNNAPNGRGWEYRYVAFELTESTTITIGVRGSVGTVGGSWAGAYAPVLAGKPNITIALNNLNTAIAEAEKIASDAKYDATVKQTFTQALSNANAAKSSTDKTAIDNATAALESATSDANASIAVYTKVAALNDKAATLDADGQKAYASTLAAYNNGTISTVAEAEAALIAAVKAQTTVGADLTLGYITNPGAELGVAAPWEVSGRVINGSSDAHTGSSLFETAGWGPHSGKMTLKVTLPKGKYDFKAFGMASAGTTEKLVVYNEDESETLAESASVVGVGASGENRWFQLTTTTVNIPKEQTVVLAAESSTDGDKEWANFDDFSLIYQGEADVPVIIADLTVKDGVAVAESQDAKNITYVREFKAANKWQSLYLPFSVNLENNDADVVLAKVDDVVEDNGELVINIVKVTTTETVEARKPLFIAAKTVGIKNIKTGVSTISEPNDGGNEYSAAEFIGVLSEARAGYAGKYVMSGGELCLVPQSMDNLTLGVNRWAMFVSNGMSVRVRINAEGFSADEATAIASAVAESVENGEIFSINGAKVKDAKSGLYIKGGKKVLVK